MKEKNSSKYYGKDLEAMSFAKNYHRWILDEFREFIGKNVAEVGAGTGNFSEFLIDSGIENLAAFEPSENMFSQLSEKFKSNKKVSCKNSYFEDQSHLYNNVFDSIMYINVLEHIENDSEALKHAHQSLRPNGHLLIFVPALKFLFSELDKKVGHFRRYTKGELENVITSSGFNMKTIKYVDIAGIIPWYIAFVLLKKTTTTSNVSAYDKLIVPIMKKIELNITPPIGKNLIAIAQKK